MPPINSLLSVKLPHGQKGIQRISLVSGILLIMLFVLCSSSKAADNKQFRSLAPETTNLNEYKWHFRPIVIFAPSQDDVNYVQQIKMLEKSKAELAERDIIVLSDTSPAAKGHLRSQLNPKGFELVLVGKDGGMKLRELKPISSEALLPTIDSMPMRKAHLD